MIKAILWKEWKKERWLFTMFLFGSITVPPALMELHPRRPDPALWQLGLWWSLYAMILGFVFVGENKRKIIPFLLARPSTKSAVFCAHHVCRFTLLAALIIISLTSFCAYVSLRKIGVSSLAVIFHPVLVFDVVICIFVFSLSALLDVSLLTFGATAVGVLILSFAFALFLLRPALPLMLVSIGNLSPTEAPAAFLEIVALVGLVSVALFLAEISFDEIRDRMNKKWLLAVTLAVALAILTFSFTFRNIARVLSSLPNPKTIEEIRLTDDGIYPLMVITSDDMGDRFLLAVQNPISPRGPLVKLKGKGLDDVSYMKKLSPEEKAFSFPDVRSHRGRASSSLLMYFSEKPLWGQEIRTFDLMGGFGRIYFIDSLIKKDVRSVSPRDYSLKETIGIPFLSPDADRIAYLKTTTSRFSKNSSASLWMMKLGETPLSGHVDLEVDAETALEPIGWTPDGFDFLLRKTTPTGSEIWAVDWTATGARRFLPEFSDAIITDDDLPKYGEWISLVQRNPGGKYLLWAVNYRSGEKVKLGLFDNIPQRRPFAYLTPNGGWCVWRDLDPQGKRPITRTCYEFGHESDEPPAFENKPLTLIRKSKKSAYYQSSDKSFGLVLYFSEPSDPHKSLPEIREMKRMATVVAESDAPNAKKNLTVPGPEGECKVLVENFTANEKQWDWLSDQAIVYAKDGQLWQVDKDGEQTLVLSAASFQIRSY